MALLFFLSFSDTYFSPRRDCPRVVKFYRGFLLTKKIGFQPQKKFGDPPRGRFSGFLVFFLRDLTELDYRTIIELYSDLIFLWDLTELDYRTIIELYSDLIFL
jgi:hypothetical protein